MLEPSGNRNTNGNYNNRANNTNLWSSTAYDTTQAWQRNFNYSMPSVNRNYNNKANGFSLRCLQDGSPCFLSGENLFTRKILKKMKNQLLTDLFRAYYDARRNKRTTVNALKFELDYETRIFDLHRQIVDGTYKISRSICFISFDPVRREIFAGDFRDRIVHHLIFNYVSPLFERIFINDVYSCRTGRGTSYGIRRLDHAIRSCSHNYARDCYVLKLDISGYFMSMDRQILFDKIEKILSKYRHIIRFDFDLVLGLIRNVVFHDPTKHCHIKGKREDWSGLPRTKSLFYSAPNKGLPIGNLTSQLFGNLYLNDLDHYIRDTLGCRYYGRYVDDFFIVHTDREYLKSIIPQIRDFLIQDTGLTLHPNKIYLQHQSKGVPFLGAYIKPHRIYVGNRTKAGFYRCVKEWNGYFRTKPVETRRGVSLHSTFLSSINSYLGITKQFSTYRLRRKMLREEMSASVWNNYHVSGEYGKVVRKRRVKK